MKKISAAISAVSVGALFFFGASIASAKSVLKNNDTSLPKLSSGFKIPVAAIEDDSADIVKKVQQALLDEEAQKVAGYYATRTRTVWVPRKRTRTVWRKRTRTVWTRRTRTVWVPRRRTTWVPRRRTTYVPVRRTRTVYERRRVRRTVYVPTRRRYRTRVRYVPVRTRVRYVPVRTRVYYDPCPVF